jgi:hypothetical protein
MTYEYQSLIVLPSIRLNRLRSEVTEILAMEQGGDTLRGMVQDIMETVEKHLEVDAYRWGNACPETGERVHSDGHGSWVCPTHGRHGHMEPMELLIAFKPSIPS